MRTFIEGIKLLLFISVVTSVLFLFFSTIIAYKKDNNDDKTIEEMEDNRWKDERRLC